MLEMHLEGYEMHLQVRYLMLLFFLFLEKKGEIEKRQKSSPPGPVGSVAWG
jgi:hypothetical protein